MPPAGYPAFLQYLQSGRVSPYADHPRPEGNRPPRAGNRRAVDRAGPGRPSPLPARSPSGHRSGRPATRPIASQSYNQLVTLIQKPLEDWDRVSIDMNRLLDRFGNSGSPLPDDPAVVLGLIKQLESDLETLAERLRSTRSCGPSLVS